MNSEAPGWGRYRPVGEALGLLAVTFPLAVGLHLSTLWLLIPFTLITFTRRSYDAYGLTFRDCGGPRFHAAVVLAVFLPYTVAYYLLAHWGWGARFDFRLPPGFVHSAMVQVLLIAFPEEFFFRGYFQTQLDRAWTTPYKLLGARWGIGLVVTAAVFAACHVVHGGWSRLLVFFPGLLYGWLRARSGTVLVPTVYHALSNLLLQVLRASFSR